jgi:hypothetical protein
VKRITNTEFLLFYKALTVYHLKSIEFDVVPPSRRAAPIM